LAEDATMGAIAEISKKQPRGRPFRKGVSGNPGGRPKRTEEEGCLAERCREKTPEALAVIESLMRDSSNDRVKLAAAEFVIERGWGRAPERIEIQAGEQQGPLPGSELTPEEAYRRLVRGERIELATLESLEK
jgi:hypothetical protein